LSAELAGQGTAAAFSTRQPAGIGVGYAITVEGIGYAIAVAIIRHPVAVRVDAVLG